MAKSDAVYLSVVLPVYNEAASLPGLHASLLSIIGQASSSQPYEIIYVNDGSRDKSLDELKAIAKSNRAVRVLSLSRNFGKEIATTAGIHLARGQAIITLDSDGQHPVELIPQFLAGWHAGSKVVVGLRRANKKAGLAKRAGSKLFYWLFNHISGVQLVPGATDFRLIDADVQADFSQLTEHNRITRGLVDWLGYPTSFVEFKANPRLSGDAGYSFKKLFKLAVDSIISLSISPLYISAYIGAVLLPAASLLGLFMLLDALAGDPAGLHATGSAYLIVLLLFLMGILLVSQGIIGLYLSHIHTETQNRPLYIVDKQKSVRAGED